MVIVVPRPGTLSIIDMPARLLDEAVDLAQAEARALADFLGGEERLERARRRRPASCRRRCRCTAIAT